RAEDVVEVDRLRTRPPLVVTRDGRRFGLVPDGRVARAIRGALELLAADDGDQAGEPDPARQVGNGEVNPSLRVEKRLVDLAHGELLLSWSRTSPWRTGNQFQPNRGGRLLAASVGFDTTLTRSAPGLPVLNRAAGCCCGGGPAGPLPLLSPSPSSSSSLIPRSLAKSLASALISSRLSPWRRRA